MGHAIGIDVGSTNTKVVLIDEDGTLVARASRPTATTLRGSIGEQDAEAVWDAVCDALTELTASAPAAAGVSTVGVCSQYSSTVAVGADLRPLAPMVTYFDTRGTDLCWAIMERHPDAFATWVERHGIPPIGGGLSLAHVLHLQLERPEVHEATTAYLEVMDFVTTRLTGTVNATQCTQFTSQLCDNRTVGHERYDDDLIALAGIDASRLPPLVPIDGVAGTVTPEASARTGLPVGVEVRVGMNDSHAGAFATGALRPDRAGLMVGTTAVLLQGMDRLAVDLDHEVLSMPAPVPDGYLVWAENGVAGKAVAHVLDELLLADDVLGHPGAADGFANLDAALEASPPGARGLLFLPWLAGSLSPRADRGQRGALLGLSFESRRVDVVRAAVEGTAHNLRWLLPHVEAFSGRPAGEVVFGGGAARSDGWAQIIADVLSRPVVVLDEPDLAAARAVASVALQRHRGEVPTEASVPVRRTVDPSAAAASRYDDAHAAFVDAFDATRPLVERLSVPVVP